MEICINIMSYIYKKKIYIEAQITENTGEINMSHPQSMFQLYFFSRQIKNQIKLNTLIISNGYYFNYIK